MEIKWRTAAAAAGLDIKFLLQAGKWASKTLIYTVVY